MKPVWFALVLFLAVHVASAGEERARTSKDCDPEDRTYFPSKEPHPFPGKASLPGINNFYCDLFSRHLRAMNEPPLLGREQETDARAYRIVVLPDVGKPHLFRLELVAGGGWRLTEKATDATNAHEVRDVIFEQSGTLTKEEAAQLTSAIDALDLQLLQHSPAQFASVVLTDPATGQREPVIFGDAWLVFEFVQDGRYLVRVRRRGSMDGSDLMQIVRLLEEWRGSR